MNIDNVLNQLIEKLKAANPYKIILFGSYAKGTAASDSDIDLIVILDNYYISRDYKDEVKRYIAVRKLILDINRNHAMDLKVYSKAEFNMKKRNGNFFIQEIEKTGKTIYEKWN
ncbi:MAG: nucleotidyltransferase domain-containing protein [Endomicrobium sp.]|jgi:predicted nucleotidyltransferase|nr:nucleotidyltransferase domain-containing protein [Endomicrobium sp.]